MRVVLYHPDIPQNTGNIGRTCVALGAELVLVRPLGFSLADKFVRRAGMDYWDQLQLFVADSLEEALDGIEEERVFYLSTKGTRYYGEASLFADGAYVFGSESKGLPNGVLERYRNQCFFVPMLPGTRSLNLATTVGIVLYEAVRQNQEAFAFRRV